MDLEAVRDQLVTLGVTPEVLLGVGAFSLLVLFFSARIVIKWYLGIQFVQDELRIIRKQLVDIELHITKDRVKAETASIVATTETDSAVFEKPAPSPSEETTAPFKRSNETFKLTH